MAGSTPIADRAAIAQLRAFLAETGFDADGVRGVLRAGDNLLADRFDLPVHLRRLADDPSPLATLVELFVLSTPVPRGRAGDHIGDAGLELLAGLGLLDVGDAIAGRIRLVPHDELLIGSD